jgi:hypothetical protein
VAWEAVVAGRRLVELTLSEAERAELNGLAGRRKTAQALAMRARIILACADGTQNKDVASSLGLHPMTVGKWRRRFLSHRLDGCTMSRAPAHPAKSTMPGSKPWWCARWKANRTAPRTGVPAAWRKPAGFR